MTEKLGVWERLPEWARWILLAPAVILFATIARMIWVLTLRWASPGPGWGWFARWWGNLVLPACIGALYGPIIVSGFLLLAPRGHRVVGWIAYLLFVGLNIAAVIQLVWPMTYTDEVCQGVVEAVAGIIASTTAFFELLAQMKRESANKPKTS